MILCQECGNSAPSRDGFCSSCGALLDWSGEQVETRVLPVVPTTTAPKSATEQAWTPAPTPTQGPRPGPSSTPATRAATPPPTTTPARPTAQRPAMSPPPMSARFAPPPPPPQRQPQQRPNPAEPPAGWLPAAEARRAEPVPAAAEPEYTGPYCQACGVRNPEGRRFCRSCGAMLQLPTVAAAPRRGWWRRLIDRLLGRRHDFAAGERPAGFRDHHAAGAAPGQGSTSPHRGGLRLPRHIKLGKLAPLLIVAGLAGVGLGPARGWVTNEINALLGKAKARVSQHYVNVTPVGATADAEPGHGAGLAVDGLSNTYWASAKHPDGAGDSITVTFASPVDIDQIGILSGADPQNFRASARPHDLTVSAAGVPATVLSFDDSADFQSRGVTLRHVTAVTLTVNDSYPGQKQHDLAIRDIEFFVKSS